MANWATAVFQRDEDPTAINAGAFTCKTANGTGLFPVRPPLAAIYPLGVAGTSVEGFATGASISIMRKP